MILYEHIFLLRQDMTTPQIKDKIEKYRNLIIENKGEVRDVNDWGMRTMAYLVKGSRRSYHIAMNIASPPAAIQEMNRKMRIDEDVLRFFTLSVKKHEGAPSLTVQRNDRDDRSMRDKHTDRKRNLDEEKVLL